MKASCKFPYEGCKCFERMGNDFWFLPADQCFYEDRAVRINREILAGVARQIPSTDDPDYPPKTEHSHLAWMTKQLLTGAVTGDKAHRWLGFIQGVLAARGFLNVDDERNRTRLYLSADVGTT